MKRFFTLFIALFLVASSYAAINASRLTISSFGNTTLSVVVDGRRYDRVENALTLDQLPSGYHDIKVYEVRSERRFLRNTNNYRLLYSSNLLLKPEHHVNITINRMGEVVLKEQNMNRRNDRDNRSDDRWNNGRNGDRYNDGRNNDPRGYNQPMSDRSFLAAKDVIRREGFDRDKALVAKQIVSNNTLYTSQVKEIMQLFSFDDAKLDFAKYAYGKTVDRNNYFMLFDSFSFRKNKEELANYIQTNRF